MYPFQFGGDFFIFIIYLIYMTEPKFCFKNEYAIKPFNIDGFTAITPGGDYPIACLPVDELAIQASTLISQLGR